MRFIVLICAASLILGVAPCARALEEGAFSGCYCDKHLLPAPLNPVPGRKYGRDRHVDIQHLKLDVTPDFARRTVSGTATLSFKPIARPLPALELDAVGLHIDEVTANGAVIRDREQTKDKLVITFADPVPADREVSLAIRYWAQPEQGLYFRTPEMGYKEGDTQVWSQGEAELHRYWFPSYDYPNERFTSEVICHVPEGMEVVSNGSLKSSAKAEGGLVAWHWLQDKPHVNYLVALAAGYFHRLEGKAGSVPLAMLVPPSEAGQAANAFRDTQSIIGFYNDEIGVPFPWDKYFQVYCLDFVAGGMENTSCTFESVNLLFTDETEQIKSLRWLDAHETAHQWFGDLVTCRDWSHLWLNEGFASYYTILYEEHRMGRDPMLMSLWREAERVFEAKDSKPTVWRDYEDPMQQFDYRVYPKGAWVLHMLRNQLGPELYRQCIKTYLERHHGQVVDTEDLHDVVAELSGRSFDQFFDQWLYHGGAPDLKISYNWDAASRQAKLNVKQAQKLSDTVPLFRFPLTVRFLADDGVGGKKGSMKDFEILVSRAEEDFYFPLSEQPGLVRVDPEYTLLAKVDFQPPPEMLKRQLKADTIGRMLAVRILAGRKDADSVKRLEEVLGGDAFYGVRSEAAKALKKIGTPEARAALVAGLRQEDARVRLDVVEALGSFSHPDAWKALDEAMRAEKNPEVQAAIIRSWGARPGDPDVAASLRDRLKAKNYRNSIATASIATLRAQDDATAVSLILQRLRDDPLGFRTWDFAQALDALGFLAREQNDRTEPLQFISGYLTDPREELRSGAAKALGTLRDPRALALLEPMINVAKPFDDPVRKAAEKSVQDLQSQLSGPLDLKNVWDKMQRLEKRTEELEKELEKLRKSVSPEKPKEESAAGASGAESKTGSKGASR